ncbi:TetR/AcrR family transcriptional regulator [Anaerocolumna sp. AGMB13025]|uniref:TetR/AcrR family transcriptional regulator n=1 Tax=Anaerocolumna sp. AGMB13025 TaxID=3039116 RepID=UPI00241D57FC|nr:TetR/AcrR family transcriptional regulator [Anaerocolumna sp. AGMB13025]WFR56591.1 TetR/AcrR family transcriptional regulator [Anaerocolumna sp. AGMB13025]
MVDKKNTKEMIENVALDLFSKKGYKAVSIRDIGKQVGIKESSIYYHFSNKQAIMDSLLQKIDILIGKMKASFETEFTKLDTIQEVAFCEVAIGFLKNYLLSPHVYKVLSVLTIEQMSDKKAYEIYQRLVFELPLLQQEQVFREMIERGYIKPNNPTVLAHEYYSVIYFAFQKNCVGCEVTDEKINIACEEINININDIFRKMKGV